MGLVIGGSKAWRVRAYGDIGLAFHWVNGDPSMVIYPLTRGIKLTGAMPYVLPLQSAHELVKEGSSGMEVDSEQLWAKAVKAAEVIGGDVYHARKIADIMLSALDELCDMPPEPRAFQPDDKLPGKLLVDGKVVYEG